MAKTSKSNLIGSWAFLIGVVLAVILGLFGSVNQAVLVVLVIIGFIVGLLNIADKETMPFLMSGVVLIIAGSFGQAAMEVIPLLNNILQALLAIFVPATIIVAIKNVFSFAKG